MRLLPPFHSLQATSKHKVHSSPHYDVYEKHEDSVKFHYETQVQHQQQELFLMLGVHGTA